MYPLPAGGGGGPGPVRVRVVVSLARPQLLQMVVSGSGMPTAPVGRGGAGRAEPTARPATLTGPLEPWSTDRSRAKGGGLSAAFQK